MDYSDLEVKLLHNHPEYLKECCILINAEWPRSETARMMSLQASCDQLPTSLILVRDEQVLGHCKLTRIPSMPLSCFIETVVISKTMRGKRLGTYLMRQVERYCRDILKLETVHLSTKGQEEFYAKLGYEFCAPISIYGTSVNSYKPPPPVLIKGESMPQTKNMICSGVPPAPPPPPMPTATNSAVCTLKTSKTFMFKYLR